MSAPKWAAAVCLKVNDPELWFSEASGPGMSEGAALAVQYCWTCPIREACLADALATESGGAQTRFGIRGGLMPSERAQLVGAAPAWAGKPCPDTTCPGTIKDRVRGCRVCGAGAAGRDCPDCGVRLKDRSRGCPQCSSRRRSERDQAILAAFESGTTLMAISRDLDLPYGTVRNVIARNTPR